MKIISLLLAALLGIATIPATAQNTGVDDTASWTEIDLPPETVAVEEPAPVTPPVVLTLTADEAMIAVDALRAARAPQEDGWTGFSIPKWWDNNWKVITVGSLAAAAIGGTYAIIDHNSGSSKSSATVELPTVGDDQTTATAIIGDGSYGNTVIVNVNGQQGNSY